MCWKRFVICICRFPALLFLLLWLPVPKPRRFFPTHLISKSDIFEPGLFAWEPLGMNLVLPSGNSTSWGTKSITHLLLLFFLIKGWLRQKITMMSPNLLRRSENFHLLQLAFTDLWWFAVPRKATRTALNNGQYNGEGTPPPPNPHQKTWRCARLPKRSFFSLPPPVGYSGIHRVKDLWMSMLIYRDFMQTCRCRLSHFLRFLSYLCVGPEICNISSALDELWLWPFC